MIRILCADDKNKPEEIQLENWIKEGEYYTAIRCMWLPISQCLAVQLNEIDDRTPPYMGWFRLDRFLAFAKDVNAFQELIRATKEEAEMNKELELWED